MRSASAKDIAAVVVALAAAIAFWVLALNPQREESSRLATQAEQLSTEVDSARSEVGRSVAARRAFPAAYQQLVELGQAVPATDETPSLLVELGHLAAGTGVKFESIQLNEGAGEEAAVETTEGEGSTSGEGASATEVQASLLPLGATIGAAGLAVMPYTLQFKGNYGQIASFISKLDAQVKAGKKVAVNGRLITINGFSLTPEAEAQGEGSAAVGTSPELDASFSVTTYLTPPGGGSIAGASPGNGAETSTQSVAAR